MRCLLLVASLLLSIFSFAQPSNDDCANALVIPISPNGACSTEINGTTVGATPSAVAACVGTAEDDIWFKFTATKTEHVVSWFIQTAITQPVIEVFSGACGALVSIKCSERAVLPWLVQDIVTNLTVGQDYYVRIYDKDAASPRSPVKMCVYEPPVNDDCTGAILTTINTDTSWTNFTQASFQYSTASGPFCGSVLNNGDVWYKFVASDSIQRGFHRSPRKTARQSHC